MLGRGGGQLGRDRGDQRGVLGQAEDVVDAVVLAPRRSSSRQSRCRPGAGSRTRGHAARICATIRSRSLDRARRGVDVRGPQPGREQVVAAEDVQRQVAVALVVAVEEAAHLVAVDRVVGGVEVEDDLLGRPRVGLEEEVTKRLASVAGRHRSCCSGHPAAAGVFEAVERALAGERRAVRPLRLEPVGEQREQRVAAQLVVVVDVLVAQGDADDPLPDQGRKRVHHLVLLAVIDKASRPPARSGRSRDRCAAAATRRRPSHGAGVERRHHPAPPKAFKLELFRATLCRHRTPLTNPVSVCPQQHYPRFSGPMHLLYS